MKKLFIFLCCIMSSKGYSQQILKDKIFSENLNKTLSIQVALPNNYSALQNYSVIYVLDPDQLFYEIVANMSYASMYDYTPPSIVVGIEYVTPRNRSDLGFNIDRLSLTNKGEDFANYIGEELIPYINKNYTTGAKNTIIGFSFTATYLYWWLINKPQCFDNYVLLSPEKTNIQIDELTEKIAPNIKDKRIVCVIGEDDVQLRIKNAKKLMTSLQLLNLAASVDYRKIPEKSHTTVIPFSVPVAINLLFKDYINELKLKTKYENRSSLIYKTSDLYKLVNDLNQKNYGVPLKLESGNMIFLVDRAYEIENDKKTAQSILNDFADYALRTDDIQQISNVVFYEREFGNLEKAEEYLRKAVNKSNNKEEKYDSWNVRVDYIRNILAKKDKDYAGAWKELDKMIEIFHPDKWLMIYYKGQIAAQYNYNNEKGILFLLQVLENIETVQTYNIYSDAVFSLIAKCYYNLKDKEQAIKYIQQAISLDPENDKYRNLLNKIKHMD